MPHTFYRLEQDGIGPHNHPAHPKAARLCREMNARRPELPCLASLTDGNPTNWRSGCASLTDLHAYFAPVLGDLIRLGFRAHAYTVPHDLLLHTEGQAAAHTEHLHDPEDVTPALLTLHRETPA